MFAIAAVVAFGVALVLHLVGHGTGALVTTCTLAGFVLLALHFCIADWPAWPRSRPQA